MKITIEIDDIDYGALAEKILHMVGSDFAEKDGLKNTMAAKFLSMPPSVAKSMINLMPKVKKDELAVLLLNKNSRTIAEKITDVAEDKGVSLKIKSIFAE